jgi:2-deoxy-D-gluconate 3-dehydrogenase
MELFNLTGRTALITGGNGGIGRGIALGFAKAGANVLIAGRNATKTDGVVEEVTALGASCTGIQCDVSSEADRAAAVEAAQKRFGGLDILVNNAGISGGGPAEAIPEEIWDAVLGINLKAVFSLSQVAYPLLKASAHGKIINIGSEYSLFGSAFVVPYSASKGGVIQLTKSLAVAWAKDNIQVNAIIPGWISTDMTAAVEASPMGKTIVDRTPAARFGLTRELEGAALLLASSASDFITGISLPVDGGYSIM